MAGGKVVLTLLVVVFLSVAAGENRDSGEVHHVVGDGVGGKPHMDLVSWLSGRIFRVGDVISFGYWAADDSIVEVKTLEEFLSCDLSNPIKMYSDGANKIPLESEGARYFTSGKVDNCKNGLKLPVKVHPKVAAAPTSPSSSTYLTGITCTFFLGLLLPCFFGL